MIINDVSSPFGTYPPGKAKAALIRLARRLPTAYPAKKLAFLIRKILILSTGRMPLDVETFGLNLRLYGFDNVAEKRLLYTPQYFDAPEREVIRQAMHDNFVFVDIGANAGGYSLYTASLKPKSGKIIAIDPQSSMMERLKFNVATNKLDNIRLFEVALGAAPGEITLYVNENNRGQTSLIASSDSTVSNVPVRVAVTTLHSIIEQSAVTHIDALKIDAEGWEDEILVPFFSSAPKDWWPKKIIIENTPAHWKVDLYSLLNTWGYELTGSTRLNRIFALT